MKRERKSKQTIETIVLYILIALAIPIGMMCLAGVIYGGYWLIHIIPVPIEIKVALFIAIIVASSFKEKDGRK